MYLKNIIITIKRYKYAKLIILFPSTLLARATGCATSQQTIVVQETPEHRTKRKPTVRKTCFPTG